MPSPASESVADEQLALILGHRNPGQLAGHLHVRRVRRSRMPLIAILASSIRSITCREWRNVKSVPAASACYLRRGLRVPTDRCGR